MASNLHVLHKSAKPKLQLKPKGMSYASMPAEARDAVGELVLGVFTDMSNAGASLQATLTAIYLTGMENAMSITKEH